jgi:hypothetical protein
MAHRKNPHLVMVMNPRAKKWVDPFDGTPVSQLPSEYKAWVEVLQIVTKGGNANRIADIARQMIRQVSRGVHTNPGGEKFSNHVQAIVYEHVTEGPRAHGFGNADPDLRTHGRTLSMTGLKEKTDVAMYAMPDGSIHIRGGRGQRLWRKDR